MFVDDEVPVWEDAPLPDADVEDEVCVVALLEPPCPELAVEEVPVEVVACEDPEPAEDEPEPDVWVDAWPPPDESEPLEDEPEVEVWVWADEPFEPAPPAVDDPDELVVVEAEFPELPEPESDGLLVVAPVFV